MSIRAGTMWRPELSLTTSSCCLTRTLADATPQPSTTFTLSTAEWPMTLPPDEYSRRVILMIPVQVRHSGALSAASSLVSPDVLALKNSPNQ